MAPLSSPVQVRKARAQHPGVLASLRYCSSRYRLVQRVNRHDVKGVGRAVGFCGRVLPIFHNRVTNCWMRHLVRALRGQ